MARRFWRKVKRCITCYYCCWTFTVKDYDASQTQPPKKFPPVKPAPKITRREEHVEYIRNRPRRGSKHKRDTDIKSSEHNTEVYTAININDKQTGSKASTKCNDNEPEESTLKCKENETEVYFCSIQPTFNPKALHPPLLIPEYDSTGKERKGGKDSEIRQSKGATPRGADLFILNKGRGRHVPPQDTFRCWLPRSACDSRCPSSLQSNQSLEIKSHVLTKSVSHLSSIQSAFSIQWRRRFPRQKQLSALQTIVNKITCKIKGKKKLIKPVGKREKKNVLVLHVPKNFSNTSTDGRVPLARASTFERPLVIRDESTQALPIERSASVKPKKICGPGEVLFQRNTYQNLL